MDIRGRSRTLRINYRTFHQIRQQADRLLGDQAVNVDGNSETRSDFVHEPCLVPVLFLKCKTAPEGAVFASSAFQHCEIKQRWLPF